MVRTTALTVLARSGLGVAVLVATSCGRVGYELEPGRPDGAGDVSGNDAGSGGAPADGPSGGTGGKPARDASPDSPPPRDGGPDRAAPADADASDAADAGEDDASDDASDGATCTPPGPAPDYCSALPPLASPPTIDGELDCGLSLRTLALTYWNGAAAAPAGIGASYAIAFRPDGLYVYVRVRDPDRVPADPGTEAWLGDGVEIYVDSDGAFAAPPAFDDPGTRQIQIVAPADDVTAISRGELFTCGFDGTRETWTSDRFLASPRPDGYTVEAFVTAAELGVPPLSLARGGRVGVDLGLNVSRPTADVPDGSNQGHRAGQFFLRIAQKETGLPGPFADVGAFCTPVLEQ